MNLFTPFICPFFFNPSIPGHAISVLFPEHFDYTLFLASSFLSVTPSPYSYPDFPINPITIRGMLNRDRATSYWGREKKIRLGWDESEQRRQDGAEWWHRRQQLSKTDREAVREGSLACNTHTHTHTFNTNWGTMDSALLLILSPPSLKTISAFFMFLACLSFLFFYLTPLSPSSVLFPFCQVFFRHPHFPADWVQSGCLPRSLVRGVHGQQSPSFHQPNPHPLKSSTRPVHQGWVCLSWLSHTHNPHTLSHTPHTGVPFKGKRRRKHWVSPKGESLLVV